MSPMEYLNGMFWLIGLMVVAAFIDRWFHERANRKMSERFKIDGQKDR